MHLLFHSSGSRNSEMGSNQVVGGPPFLSRGPRGEIICCFFLLPKASCIPYPVAASLQPLLL